MSVLCAAANMAKGVDVFGTGLLAGILVMSALAALPAAAGLEASSRVRYRQALIHRLAPFMPPLMVLPAVAPIAVLAACSNSVAAQVEIVGCAFSVATLAITVTVNARLSARIARWSPDTLPERWETDLRRWDAAHAIRTATAVSAFVCAILAMG